MINNIIQDERQQTSKISDIVFLANTSLQDIDSRVLQIPTSTSLLIKGEITHNLKGKYAVVGGEIVLITSSTIQKPNTLLEVEREQFHTPSDIQLNSHIRTGIVLTQDPNVIVQSWDFEDSLGSVTSTLFPVELSSGNVTLNSNLNLWSPHSPTQKYRVRPRHSIVYIFKYINDKYYLKATTIVSKIKFNTRGKTEPNKIILELKSLLYKWYDKDLTINTQLKNTKPKDFFKTVFGLEDSDILYCDGVSEDSFLKINNLHTKEYKKVNELLKAYCKNGVRFIFDRKEKLRIFGDIKVEGIEASKVVNYNITNLMLSENEQLIYNTIATESYQRQPLYNFEDLDKKFVTYLKKIPNCVDARTLVTKQPNGDYVANPITIKNSELHSSVQLKDYVTFKRVQEPQIELPAQVVGLESDSQVVLLPILKDKDYKLFPYGKGEYLYNLFNLQTTTLDLHYGRNSLPIIFKFTRNVNNEEKDNNLMFPLLPKVNGERKYEEKVNIEFGCASNLKVGSYTNIVEEIQGIYGVWNSKTLKYNREIDQFANKGLPPIAVLSNMMTERTIGEKKTPIKYFTTFDNSNLELEVKRPTTNNSDATLILSNKKTINSDIDLMVGEEIGRIGNKILQVENIDNYKIGDVLICNRPDDLTLQEEIEFDEVLSTIKWTIVAKDVQSVGISDKNYIFLDSPFAKRQKPNAKYTFTKFPNTSIVFLQELYMRGNPVIEVTQEVNGISKGSNSFGDTSVDLYGDKPYDIDSKQLDKYNLRMLMGYILDNYQATNPSNTKYVLPISLVNALDIETLDVISVIDPIFTSITKELKWIVLSTRIKSNTNEVELKLLNLNNKDTVPYKMDIKDIMQYKPVELPDYSHTGGEGSSESNNDGQGGTDVDPTLGQFWLAEVDPQVFRARVEKFTNNYIYFKDFSGTEVDQYTSKLFPVSEFAVNINGEVMFVQSDDKYRAYIKKRRVYDTEETVISPEDDVKFLVTTTYVDVDGTLYGRKMMIGDGDSYLAVDPIKGVKIVGDFVVGENNKNSNNDLWQSLQNNRTFQQTDRPINTPSYQLKEGDIWYDIDDENHAYRYDGRVWVSARDGSIVSTHNNVFIQAEEPTDKDGKKLVEGDTWYNTALGNRPYIYQNGVWVEVSDTTLQEGIEEVKKKTEENFGTLQDIFKDNIVTPDEKLRIKLMIEEIEAEYPKIISESEKFGLDVIAYRQSYNLLISYCNTILLIMYEKSEIDRRVFEQKFADYYSEKQTMLNGISSRAKELADKAQQDATVALGNAKIFYQTEPPVDGMKKNDLWYDTDDDNHPHIYNGSSWVSARDKIFETEGGNKVYFQSSTPPTSGRGVKEGDQWFDTGHNNIQYVLMTQPNGQLAWKLANDSLDKINNGRVVLNANTTVNGDFRVRGSNIELTGATKVNGILEVFSGNQGIISYNGTTEGNSTRRIVIKGGEILFQEKI